MSTKDFGLAVSASPMLRDGSCKKIFAQSDRVDRVQFYIQKGQLGPDHLTFEKGNG